MITCFSKYYVQSCYLFLELYIVTTEIIISLFKWTYGLFVKDYRVVTLTILYLLYSGILMPIGLF